jgi:hypothetical protein
MILQLKRYNISLVYKKGKDLLVADTLSRAYLQRPINHEPEYKDLEVLTFEAISNTQKEKLILEKENDKILKKLRICISEGWPKNKRDSDIAKFFDHQHEITKDKGIIYKGLCIIVP